MTVKYVAEVGHAIWLMSLRAKRSEKLALPVSPTADTD